MASLLLSGIARVSEARLYERDEKIFKQLVKATHRPVDLELAQMPRSQEPQPRSAVGSATTIWPSPEGPSARGPHLQNRPDG
jgi:hypothetical protein